MAGDTTPPRAGPRQPQPGMSTRTIVVLLVLTTAAALWLTAITFTDCNQAHAWWYCL